MNDEMKCKIGEVMSIAPWTSLDLSRDKKDFKNTYNKIYIVTKKLNRSYNWKRRSKNDK